MLSSIEMIFTRDIINHYELYYRRFSYGTVFDFSELLTNYLKAKDLEEKINYSASLLKMFLKYAWSIEDIPDLLNCASLEAFKNEEYEVMEFMLRTAYNIDKNPDIASNLAYYLRRYKTVTSAARREISKILLDGVRKNNAHCLINMALLFALEFGTEKDWQLADELMSRVANSDEWLSGWINLFDKEDEGILLHLWFIRHSILDENDNEKFNKLCDQVRTRYPNAPKWIYEKAELHENG